MATYSEARQLIQQLKPIIEKLIEQQPNVKSAIRAKKAVVQAAPDTQRHTVAIKFLPDLFNRDVQPMIFPYNPCLSASDLEVGKAVFVFYFQSLSNGVVMQNDTWTAGGVEPGKGIVVSVNGQTGEVVLKADDLKAVSFEQQTLSNEQQAQSRENIGAGQTTVFANDGSTDRAITELIFEVTDKTEIPDRADIRVLRISDSFPATTKPRVTLSIQNEEEKIRNKTILKIE